jgi:hypothetical protein
MAQHIIYFMLITFIDPIIDYFIIFSRCFKHYKLSHSPDVVCRLMSDISHHLGKLDYRFIV